jgi:hypothetical protein
MAEKFSMNKDTTALLNELKKLTKGLRYQSESDYAVEPFALDGKERPVLKAEDVAALSKSKSNAPVKQMDVDQFFSNAVEEQDWYGPEELQTARQFQALVKMLKEKLADLKVYEVGEVEMDAYVIGKTASGDWAGVSTKVVET